ncbi:hypothetical protein K432DRAFT_311865, partial [Lepidopterella palustris CBS 459.81]
SGALKSYTKREQRFILRQARLNPKITRKNLISIDNIDFSKSSIGRILDKYNIRK